VLFKEKKGNLKELCIKKLCDITDKKNIIFMDKCRQAVELIIRFAQAQNFNDLIIQEEGGWYTYEKSALSIGFNVVKANVAEGVIKEDVFPRINNSLIIINTNRL